jgi:hypothetical protein
MTKLETVVQMSSQNTDKKIDKLEDKMTNMDVKFDRIIETHNNTSIKESNDITNNKINIDWLKNIGFLIGGATIAFLFSLLK